MSRPSLVPLRLATLRGPAGRDWQRVSTRNNPSSVAACVQYPVALRRPCADRRTAALAGKHSSGVAAAGPPVCRQLNRAERAGADDRIHG
jgi:hypothetical protein